MASGTPLDKEMARIFLAESTTRGPKKDPTEPREIQVWFKLDQFLREAGCENPDCNDPRPETDQGTQVVAQVNGKYMCRFCFLDGYLSPHKKAASNE